MKKFIIIICFFFTGYNVFSQSAYAFDIKKDIALTSLSIGIFSWHFTTENELDMPDNLNKNDVNSFDRWLMYPSNESLKNFRDTVRFILPILPIITPLYGDIRNDLETWAVYGFMYTQAALLTSGTVGLLKKNIFRYRALEYFNDDPKMTHADTFPSDTNALSFMAATFFSVTFSKEYPDSSLKIPVIAGSYSLAATVGVTSILCGMHFLSDVLVAAAIGSFYGWLLPVLHKRKDSGEPVSFFITGSGVVLSIKL